MGIIAYIMNKTETERPLRWNLTKHQKYNLEILKDHINDKKLLAGKNQKELNALKKEINSHGWDIAVVEIAFEELLKKNNDIH